MSVYEKIDASKSIHIFGTFLDITSAFDNLRWAPLLTQLGSLGASLGTLKIVDSYLQNRWADLTIEGIHHRRKLARGCPKGSQLGPTLWKVALTPIYKKVARNQHNEVNYLRRRYFADGWSRQAKNSVSAH